MGEASPPLTVTELLQLTHVGVPLEHITWPRVSMTSNNWICIRHSRKGRNSKVGNHFHNRHDFYWGRQKETSKFCINSQNAEDIAEGKNSVVTVLNPYRGDFPQTWQTSAGSVKMNPWKPLIALKAGPVFQIYNLETRQLLHKYRVPYAVVFWTWVNSEIIAMVTETAVYHWYISKDDTPTKIFYRHTRLANTEIVNYWVDESLRWHALIGLTIEDDRICGLTQLYSADHDLSQPFEAHAVNFVHYQFQDNPHPSTIMVAATRGEGNIGKIHVIELGPYIEGNQAPTNHTETITFVDHWEKYDFPVSVQISSKFGLAYMVTKHGRVHVCDLETGVGLCSTTICADIIFASALNTESQGIVVISRNGQVLSVDLKKDHMAHYVRDVVKRPGVADRLFKLTKLS